MRPRSYLRVGCTRFILLLSHGLGCYLKFLLCGDFVAPALPFARSWVRPHTLIAWEAIFVEHRSVFIYFVNGFVSAGFITDSLFYFRVVRAQHGLVFPLQPGVGFLCPFWGFGTRHFVFGCVLFFYFILPSFSSCKKGLDSPYLYGFVLFDWLSDFSLSAQPWLSGSFFGLRVFGLRTCFPV